MIKKLKHRVLAISMVLVSVAVALFYLMGCAAMALMIRTEVQNVLENSAEADAFNFLPSFDADNMEGYGLYYGNICVVNYNSIDHSIRIMEGSSAFLNDDLLVDAVAASLKGNEAFNELIDLGLFSYCSETAFGYNIAFTTTAQYRSQMESVLIGGSCAYVLTIIALYLINLFIAGISLKPVQRTWDQQQNFIADASHELKTPLTVILTNSNILMAHPDDTVREQMKWVESTNEEAAHMKDLVDKLLILAKTDNIQKNKLFSSVEFSDLVMRLALQFEPVAFEKGVVIETDIEDGIRIVGDQTALNQIVHILLDNAVKYAGIGGRVDLTLKRRQKYVYLSTRNTGTPIPPEDLPHVFERFYRSDKARTSGSGYGLGLAICKNLAELHKAQISVTSDETNGTVFTVRFKVDRKS